MKNLKIFLSAALAAILLVGCSGKGGKSESSLPQSSEDSLSSSAPVSSEDVSSLVPSVKPSEDYGDLLENLKVGKTLAAKGELESEQYADALLRLEGILKGYNRSISITAYSLDGKKAIGYNTQQGIFCACAVKAPYTLYCLKQMEQGKATLDTKMIYEQKHYEPGTGDMQYSPIGTEFTMKTMLHKSMSISDNVGYLMSVDYFGRDGYNEWIKSLGCPSLEIKPTVWSLRASSRDLAVAWCEIYEFFREGGEYAEFLYESCSGTAGNYATQSLKGVEYSHKQGHNRSGDWTSYTDAGIVWKEGSPYIIAIVTDAPGPSAYDAQVFADIMNIVHGELF